MSGRPRCKRYWGSHGCDLEPGHDGDHLCGPAADDPEPCSEFNEATGWVRYWTGDGWSGWYWKGHEVGM